MIETPFQFLDISIWEVVKYFVMFALFLYIIFAFVVVRQVGLMIKTVKTGFEIPLQLIAFGHLLFAFGTLFLAIVIL